MFCPGTAEGLSRLNSCTARSTWRAKYSRRSRVLASGAGGSSLNINTELPDTCVAGNVDSRLGAYCNRKLTAAARHARFSRDGVVTGWKRYEPLAPHVWCHDNLSAGGGEHERSNEWSIAAARIALAHHRAGRPGVRRAAPAGPAPAPRERAGAAAGAADAAAGGGGSGGPWARP